LPVIDHIAIITGVQDEADAFRRDHPVKRVASPLGEIRQLEHAGKHVRPDLFLVIGTAGHVSTRESDCFYLSESLQADYGTLERFGEHDGFTHYNAGAWPIGPSDWKPFTSHPMPEALALPQARIATADCFVKCPDRSGYLRDTLKADLVDMETAAVAQIAALLDIPWAGIKAVTDGANSDSSGDFHANLERAANRAADEAARFIELL
jgi:nucleoside phosphorylase